MRIALVIENLDPGQGGAEHSCLEMARLLANNGIEVGVVTGGARNSASRDFEIIDLSIQGHSRALRSKRFTAAADRMLGNWRFDIVHAITPIRRADVYQPRGGLIAETFRRSVARHGGLVGMVRRWVGPNPRQRHLQRLETYLARETDCVFLAVSDYVRRQFSEHLHLPDQRCRVIYNGVDIERLRRPVDDAAIQHLKMIFEIRPDQRVGLFVANNFKLKGFDLILGSLARLRTADPDLFNRIVILIVSTGDFWPSYKKADRLGLLERLVFIGPAQDMARVYALADFLVHPTWYDPCSRAVLEAIACRVPSITSRFNGAAEIVQEADCGIVMDELDESHLIEALRSMVDAATRDRLAANCDTVVERVSMRRHVRELIDLYRELRK